MILITGVGGFVGRHLAAECVRQGAEVAGLGRGERPDVAGLSSYERVDLAGDGEAVRAAVARIRPGWPAGVCLSRLPPALLLWRAILLWSRILRARSSALFWAAISGTSALVTLRC